MCHGIGAWQLTLRSSQHTRLAHGCCSVRILQSQWCVTLNPDSALPGSSLLATWLAGALYTRALARHGGGRACRGADCFRDTFLILAALAAAALATAVVLWHRTRPLYVKVIAWTKTERSKRGLKARRFVIRGFCLGLRLLTLGEGLLSVVTPCAMLFQA